MGIHNSILNLLLPLINDWGYWLIFLATIAESTPFGIFVPAHIIVLIAGFLAKEGILSLRYTLIISTIGAIIGDSLGYIFGRKYGYSLITRYGKYIFFKKKTFDKVNEIVNTHTGKALIIGRFNPATRSFAPFVAGASDVKLSKFMIFNIIGGTTWAVSSVMIGYIFGQSYEIASKYIGKIVFAAVIISILIILGYKFINKRWHIFTKYYLHVLMVNIASLYLFSKMVEDVIHNQLVTKLDFWMSKNIMHFWNSLGKGINIFIWRITNPAILILLSAALLVLLVHKKRWYHFWLLVAGLGGSYFIAKITNAFVLRASPENSLINAYSYSFPSIRAMLALVFFCMLFYSFKRDFKNEKIKFTFIAISAILLFLIGFSNIYLNANWLSDVIAGFALGIFWLTLLILVFKYVISLRNSLRKKGSLVI